MKFIKLSLLFLAFHGWPLPAQAADYFAQIPEDHTVTLSRNALFGSIFSTSLTVSLAPQHGQVSLSADQVHYSPAPGYVGFDHLIIEAAGGLSGSRDPIEAIVTVRVVPRAMPATTRSGFNGAQSPGFYDTVERTFSFCDPWARAYGELYCTRYSVPEAEVGWIPATGRWPEGNLSMPPLFDAETGTFYFLEKNGLENNGGSEIRLHKWFELPETIGSWPTLGDWAGDGRATPAFVALDGTVRVVDPATKTVVAVLPQLLNMSSAKAKPWPAVWPVEGRDTLAWIDSTEHKLHWNQVIPNPASETAGGEVLDLVQTGRRLPITSDVLAWAGYGDALLFFEPTDMAGADYLLVWFQHPDGNWPSPSTLPLKFPHEPPGI